VLIPLAQIEAELAAISEQILDLTTQDTSSYASHGRQVVKESARGKLEVLYARQKDLLTQLEKWQNAPNGVTGIRVRYGSVYR